jgi:hypothetical protein
MPTLAGLDGGSLLPDFMGSFNKGMEFRQGVDKNRLTPELIERARKGDQEAINQLIAINPEALKDSLTLPGLGDISAAKSAAAKSQTMIAEATQERGRLIKLKSNIAASLKDGPDNLRTNVLKLASGKMDENDPDFNMQDVVDILKISATDPERAYKMLQEESSSIEEQLSTANQILGTGGGDPFTLRENERRFDANNNLVATGQEKAASPTKIERLINARDKAIQSGDQSRASLIDKAIAKESGDAPAPVDPFKNEKALRDQFVKLSDSFVKQNASFGRIQASANNPSAAGDLALIFNYMKLLDPGSTVREGEFATAQNSGGVGQRVQAAYNKVLSGERLSPAQRKDFLGRAGGLFGEAQEQHSKRVNTYTNLSKRNNLNPENVVINLTTADPDREINTGDASADITEEDIQNTMAIHNMTREAVLQAINTGSRLTPLDGSQ